jgi:hypothetical protein
VLIAGLCIGCATAHVKNIQENRSATLPRPARVIVFDFDTGAADVVVATSPARSARRTVGLSVQEPDLLGDAVADALARRLVDEIRALGLPKGGSRSSSLTRWLRDRGSPGRDRSSRPEPWPAPS